MWRTYLAAAVVILCTPAIAFGMAYDWSNPNGGEWTDPQNWGGNNYPKYFFDLAIFSLLESYEVDASAAEDVSIAAMIVRAGDIQLRSPASMGTVLNIEGVLAPASLALMEGSLTTNDAHTIGDQASVTLYPGTALVAGASRTHALFITAGGTLRGSGGQVQGKEVRNFGMIDPGLTPGTSGDLTFSPGGLNQFAGGQLHIDLTSGGHDRVVADQAILSGRLSVALEPGYVPSEGDRFEVLSTSSAIQGQFDLISWPEGPAEFDLEYGEQSVSILVTRVAAPPASASLDIKPGSCPNMVNINSKGVTPVALMVPDEWVETEIGPEHVLLEGVAATKASWEDVSEPVEDACACEERDADGVKDLVLKFSTEELAEALGEVGDGEEVMLSLEATLPDGTVLTATDCIRVVNKSKVKAGKGSRKHSVDDAAVSSYGSTVSFRIDVAGPVRVDVFDLQGRLVERVFESTMSPGELRVQQPQGTAGGVFFYRLQTTAGTTTTKVFHR